MKKDRFLRHQAEKVPMILSSPSTAHLSELEKLEPLLQQSLRAGSWYARFPSELERLYRLYIYPSRKRRYMILALIALILYDLFAFCDWYILPDIFPLALKVRLLLVTPAILSALYFVSRQPSGRMLDLLASGMLLLCLGSLCLFMLLSRHPNVVHYYSGIAVILMFSNVIIRQPFLYALAVSALTCGMYLLTVQYMPVMTFEDALSSCLVVFTTALFSLAGNYQMAYEHRRDFLLSALQQIASKKLTRVNSQLEMLSLTDALTGLANRRHFDLTLQREWHSALRNRYSLVLIFLDVDHFKNYNDHYGHPAGDICLQRISGVLATVSKRAQDLPARYGGEEFVVLLPRTDIQHGLALAEKIRGEVQDLAMPHAHSQVAPVVTISLGVAAMIPDTRHHADDMVAEADKALYAAKNNGRNRVEPAGLPN